MHFSFIPAATISLLFVTYVKAQENSRYYPETDRKYINSVRKLELAPNQCLCNRKPGRQGQLVLMNNVSLEILFEKKDSLMADAAVQAKKIVHTVETSKPIKYITVEYADNRFRSGRRLTVQFKLLEHRSYFETVIEDPVHPDSSRPDVRDSLLLTPQFKKFLYHFPIEPNQILWPKFETDGTIKMIIIETIDMRSFISDLEEINRKVKTVFDYMTYSLPGTSIVCTEGGFIFLDKYGLSEGKEVSSKFTKLY